MTNPGAIRWKVVPSKNSSFASATNDADAFGDCLGSSSIVNAPQLVVTVSRWVFEASSFVLRLLLPAVGLGGGRLDVAAGAALGRRGLGRRLGSGGLAARGVAGVFLVVAAAGGRERKGGDRQQGEPSHGGVG